MDVVGNVCIINVRRFVGRGGCAGLLWTCMLLWTMYAKLCMINDEMVQFLKSHRVVSIVIVLVLQPVSPASP